MKYIMLEFTIGTSTKVNYPVIFPEQLTHSEVAKHMIHMITRDFKVKDEVKVISAGQTIVDVLGCSGRSETLGISSREKADEWIINQMDYMHGIVE